MTVSEFIDSRTEQEVHRLWEIYAIEMEDKGLTPTFSDFIDWVNINHV